MTKEKSKNNKQSEASDMGKNVDDRKTMAEEIEESLNASGHCASGCRGTTPETSCNPEWESSEDIIAQLEHENAKLKKECAEAEQKRLFMLADIDNQRKRIAKDMEAMRYSVVQDTLSPFLQVFEHFSMAITAAAASDNYKSLLQGLEMIQKEFDKAFSELGVVRVDAVGKDFDPALHDAVAQEASETVPAGKVIRQWSAGYKSGERLLKPAMVVVSSGPAKE